MLWKLFVAAGLVLFVLLSATDWLFTYTLLNLHPGAVESNPFAAACLERYGWTGLALYKVGGVLVFVGSLVLLVRRRPPVAAGTVTFACSVLLAVTVYTHGLISDARTEANHRARMLEPFNSVAQHRPAAVWQILD